MASTATTIAAGSSAGSSVTTTNSATGISSADSGVGSMDQSESKQTSSAAGAPPSQQQQRPSRAPQRGNMREYCLRWNNHQPNLVTFFGNLLNRESFVDVTLVSSEGRKLQAHKLVLSACSPYFQHVFESNPCKHPIVILKDVQYADLRTIVSFIYNGEVNISQDRINTILSTASTLQIKGLAEVPADELKRVGGQNKAGSMEEPRGRSLAPPLHSAWGSTEQDDGFAQTDIPRKKLKKSAGLGASTSTNGDHGSFESGVGASMSRSIDDGSGIIEGVPLRGPPPLTAGSQLSQQTKSRSLDTGMAMKHEEAANADSELSSGGFSESHGFDDSSLGADRGYDLEVADMKREGGTDDENEFDEELYDHPDNENLEFEPQSFPNASSSSNLFFQPDRQFTTSQLRRRVKYPKYRGPQVDNSIASSHKYQQAIDDLLQNPSLTFREAALRHDLNASSVWYHYRMKYGYRRKVDYENENNPE